MIIELFSRPSCHLCDEAKKVIREAARRHKFDFVERNVDDNPNWQSEYGHEVPVVLVNGRKAFKYSVSPAALERYFDAARKP